MSWGEYQFMAGNYAPISKLCAEVYASEGREATLDLLRDAYDSMNVMDYMSLYNMYRDKK